MILKPDSASRRWRKTRRKRSQLPKVKSSRHPKLKGVYIESATYSRYLPAKSRSKYEPHIGKKQLARQAA